MSSTVTLDDIPPLSPLASFILETWLDRPDVAAMFEAHLSLLGIDKNSRSAAATSELEVLHRARASIHWPPGTPCPLALTEQPRTDLPAPGLLHSGWYRHPRRPSSPAPPASPCTSPVIHWHMFPDILDAILSHCDVRTLMVFRATANSIDSVLAPFLSSITVLHDTTGRAPAHLFPGCQKVAHRQVLNRAFMEGRSPPTRLNTFPTLVIRVELSLELDHVSPSGIARFTRYVAPDLRGRHITVLSPPQTRPIHTLALHTFLCHLARADSVTVVGFGAYADVHGLTTLRRAVACSRAGNDGFKACPALPGRWGVRPLARPELPNGMLRFVYLDEYVARVGGVDKFTFENWGHAP